MAVSGLTAAGVLQVAEVLPKAAILPFGRDLII